MSGTVPGPDRRLSGARDSPSAPVARGEMRHLRVPVCQPAAHPWTKTIDGRPRPVMTWWMSGMVAPRIVHGDHVRPAWVACITCGIGLPKYLAPSSLSGSSAMTAERDVRPARRSRRRNRDCRDDLGFPLEGDSASFARAFVVMARAWDVSITRSEHRRDWEDTDELGLPTEGDLGDFAFAFLALRDCKRLERLH